jgi:hypothetical protein
MQSFARRIVGVVDLHWAVPTLSTVHGMHRQNIAVASFSLLSPDGRDADSLLGYRDARASPHAERH